MMASKSTSDPVGRGRGLWPAWAVMTVIAILLSAVIGERTRRIWFDAFQQTSPRDLSDSNVRVVLIDSESLNLVGPWPWPRYYMARLTEEVAARGASVIAFDILFSEPDRVRPDIFINLYPELSASAASEVAALEPMDQLFGKVIGRAPVILAQAGSHAGRSGAEELAGGAGFTGTLPPELVSWPTAITAIPELNDVALGHGLINASPDNDGVVRSVPLVMRVAGKPVPGLALEIARARIGSADVAASPDALRVGRHAIPVDRQGRLALHFGTLAESHIISASDVLRRDVPEGLFAGKTVLVGVTAEGTSDIVATPLASEGYGALVQAQAVDAILRGGALQRPAWARAAEWALGIGLALLALAGGAGGKRRRVTAALGFIAIPALCWIAFENMSLLIDATRPLTIGGGALAGVVFGLLGDARRKKRRLQEVLFNERLIAAAAEGELQAARAIQLSMVPARDSLAMVDPRMDVDAILEPARTVGGDFFDLTRLSTDLIAFAIGDVTGKGVPAALFMAMSKALTRSAMSRDAPDIGRAAAAINRELIRDNSEAMSVTMVLGFIDLTNGNVRLISAGHEDPMRMATGGTLSRHRLSGGPPFCIVDYDYPIESLTLARGEALVLVTDGITEAQNAGGELYGRDRILSGTSLGRGDATEICEAICSDVRRFEGGLEATDDLTVMAIRYLGAA